MNYKTLRRLIREALIAERVITIDWGRGDSQEFDIPAENIESLKQRVRSGLEAAAATTAGEEVPDRTYNIEQGIINLAERSAEQPEKQAMIKRGLQSIIDLYASSGDLGARAVKILLNSDEVFPLFTHDGTSYPAHESVSALRDLEFTKLGKAVGKAEVLACLCYGTSTTSTGGEVDVNLLSGPNPGAWHVKYIKATGTVPWGESKAAKKAFKEAIEASGLSIIKQNKLLDASYNGLTSGQFSHVTAAAALGGWETEWGDLLDSAMQAAAGDGGANGVLFAKPNEFIFKNADEIYYGATEAKGRIRVAGPQMGSFNSRVAASEEKTQKIKDKAAGIWKRIKPSTPSGFGTSPAQYDKLKLPDLRTLLKARGLAPEDVTPGIGNAWGNLKSAQKNDMIEKLRSTEDLQESASLNDLRHLIKEALFAEELTRTDKRDIKRMAKKEITSYFEAQIQKQLDKHWTKKDSKFDKYVNDKITKRFRDASKDSDFDDAVIKVSKRVMKALHDLHYKRSNLIDNMPVRK